MSQCDSSDHVSIVVVIFFTFSTSRKLLPGFASHFVSMFFIWTPTKFVKIGVLPLLFMS